MSLLYRKHRNGAEAAAFAFIMERAAERGCIWQLLFYDFVVFSDRKRVEKLRHMHRNPVKRGLVLDPEQWRWSSYRHYAYGEAGPVLVNESQIAKMRIRKIS